MITYRTEHDRIIAIDTSTQECIGEIDFPRFDAHTVTINHTFVNPNYRGQKIAETLLEQAIELLQSSHVNVVISCSYVAKQLERHPEWREKLTIAD